MACGSKSFSWRLVTTTAVFFPHYQSLIIVTTIDLSIVNNASQTGRRVAVFHWPAKVWYPCMAWTNFINRPKTSRPWLYLTEHHKMSKRKLSFPDQSSMANKRKEKYFWNIICSIIGWYKVSHRLLICKAEKSKFEIFHIINRPLEWCNDLSLGIWHEALVCVKWNSNKNLIWL
jgi:hypothetical protein